MDDGDRREDAKGATEWKKQLGGGGLLPD